MEQKYTNLSKKELKLIENLLLERRNIIDFETIYNKLKKQKSRQSVRNFVAEMVKKGWLIRIKKGIFEISDIAGRGSSSLSQLVIAQIIDPNSYISFFGALQHHGMFDQYLQTITSITPRKSHQKKFHNWNLKFIKSKKGLFNGYRKIKINNYYVKIADAEKAILDALAYRVNTANIDLVLEKIREYRRNLNIKYLLQISKNYPIKTKRILGFLLDINNVNTQEFYQQTRSRVGFSRMSQDSKIFNSKWRLYYHRHFSQYL